MKRLARIVGKTMKWTFIVFCFILLLLAVSLAAFLFCSLKIPGSCLSPLADRFVPAGCLVRAESLSFEFGSGLVLRGLAVWDRTSANPDPVASADSIALNFSPWRIVANGLRYDRLPDSYYAPGNLERNARVEVQLPNLPGVELVLNEPHVLGVEPVRVVARLEVGGNRFVADKIHLDWSPEEEPMFLDGFCYVDLVKQEVYGEVEGTAKQHHIRPLLAALDLPVSLPYMDAFTGVRGKVPSWCSWKVNLVNNDFDLRLGLHPRLGFYNLVPMQKADGDIHLHVYTRGTSLNYHHTFGPIVGVGPKGEPLEGTVVVDGLNGTNEVRVTASSALPVAHLLKIGGFTGEYVGDDVVGRSKCDIRFHFPRAMTNNYELLDGGGHVEIADGQVMRMKGFRGLLSLLAEKVPGVAWFTDSTQASCDYTIRKGVLRSDNIYIEGAVFSVKMYGTFDSCRDSLDFTVRVQFSKKDSFVGKLLHPLTWPFTKLLLEFRLTGTAAEPKWEYLSVIDRVMEAAK